MDLLGPVQIGSGLLQGLPGLHGLLFEVLVLVAKVFRESFPSRNALLQVVSGPSIRAGSAWLSLQLEISILPDRPWTLPSELFWTTAGLVVSEIG